MNLTKITTAIHQLEENEQAIAKAKTDLNRIQRSFDAARTRINRMQELQSQRNDALADALINSGKPNVAAIDDEMRQLERASSAEPMSLDVATSALAKINQRLADLEAVGETLLSDKKLACSEVVGAEIGKLEQEIDRSIAALNASVLKCVALSKVNLKFGGKSWQPIDSFLRQISLPASMKTPHISVEFSTHLLNNQTVKSHYESLVSEFEKLGVVKQRS